jgi:hypothetical protein
MQRKWERLPCFCMENPKWKCFIFSETVMRATGKCVVGSRACFAETIRVMLAAVCFYVLQFCWEVDGVTRRHVCRCFAVSIRKVKWSWVVDGVAQGCLKVVSSRAADWRATHPPFGGASLVLDTVCKTYVIRRLLHVPLPFCPKPSVSQFDTNIYTEL